MNFLCLLSICSGVPAILLSFGIKEQKTKTVKIVPKTSDLIKVYADKRLIFFSILALVQQGILMATCMSFTTQIAHEINASAFQIGLLSIVYIIVAVLASYFSASNFARRLGSSLWIPFILFVLAIYCFAVPNIFSPNLLIAIQILAGLSTGIVFFFLYFRSNEECSYRKTFYSYGILSGYLCSGNDNSSNDSWQYRRNI